MSDNKVKKLKDESELSADLIRLPKTIRTLLPVLVMLEGWQKEPLHFVTNTLALVAQENTAELLTPKAKKALREWLEKNGCEVYF